MRNPGAFVVALSLSLLSPAVSWAKGEGDGPEKKAGARGEGRTASKSGEGRSAAKSGKDGPDPNLERNKDRSRTEAVSGVGVPRGDVNQVTRGEGHLKYAEDLDRNKLGTDPPRAPRESRGGESSGSPAPAPAPKRESPFRGGGGRGRGDNS